MVRTGGSRYLDTLNHSANTIEIRRRVTRSNKKDDDEVEEPYRIRTRGKRISYKEISSPEDEEPKPTRIRKRKRTNETVAPVEVSYENAPRRSSRIRRRPTRLYDEDMEYGEEITLILDDIKKEETVQKEQEIPNETKKHEENEVPTNEKMDETNETMNTTIEEPEPQQKNEIISNGEIREGEDKTEDATENVQTNVENVQTNVENGANVEAQETTVELPESTEITLHSDEEPPKKRRKQLSDDDYVAGDTEEEEDDDFSDEEDIDDDLDESPRYALRSRVRRRKMAKSDTDEKRYSLRPRDEQIQRNFYRPEPLRKRVPNRYKELVEKYKRDRTERAKRFMDRDSDDSDAQDYRNIAPINGGELDVTGRSNLVSGDIDPMGIDKSITWDSVGGLDHHIQALKEMVILPLLYPEAFSKFSITPPKGVIFYGPPGTGKTLVARALANTCSSAGKKVAFFMRKGADILSKWVGEAEKQLRLLFERAKQLQPSIIFFDEIDGLAPVRSSKQDYIHSSIVSTLLALMDGLDNRGQVIVIGATNRIDALDPALRRPGRFDRELTFTLPSKKARNEILSIHTKNWKPPLTDELKEYIVSRCVGYCGADIKALCTEAAILAIRRNYPQIYESNEKLLIDVDKIHVTQEDFTKAMNLITPASHRSAIVHSRSLPRHLAPLLSDTLELLVNQMKSLFPIMINKSQSTQLSYLPEDEIYNDFIISPPIYRPWLLIHGEKEMGQVLLGRALLNEMEEFPIFSLDMPSLLSNKSTRLVEEAIVSTFSEARKSTPSILWLPNLEEWWDKASDLLRSTLLMLLEDIPSTLQIVFVATSEKCVKELPEELANLFPNTFYVTTPTREQRLNLFNGIKQDIKRKPLRKARPANKLPPLPKAPIEQKIPTEEEENKIREQEAPILSRLRLKLREAVFTVINKRQFDTFAKPYHVNSNDTDINNENNLIYLYDILEKIDKCEYTSVAMFLKDIEFIVDHCDEYVKNINDPYILKKVRGKANQLHDTMIALLDVLVPDDLVRQCKRITKRRAHVAKLKQGTANTEQSPLEQTQPLEQPSMEQPTMEQPIMEQPTMEQPMMEQSSLEQPSMEQQPPLEQTQPLEQPSNQDSQPVQSNENLQNEIVEERVDDTEIEKEIEIDENKLSEWFTQLIQMTEGYNVNQLDKTYCDIYKYLYKHRFEYNKNLLLDDLINYVNLHRK